MITCGQAVRQLWDYVDGVVEEPERALLEEHLAFCRRCCGELEFAEELRDFLATHVADELPPDVRERLAATLDELDAV